MEYMIKIYATCAVALAMFLCAGLWNLLVFPYLGISFEEGFLRSKPIFPLIIVGYVLISAVLVYIGTHSTFSVDRPLHWVIVGVLVMELAFGLSAIVMQANYNFPLQALPFDLVWYVIEGAVGGFVASRFFRV